MTSPHRFHPHFTRALALAGMLWTLAAHGQVLIKEVASREVSVHVGGVQTPDIKDVVSREVSIAVANGIEPYGQAISREVSLVITTPAVPPQVTDFIVTPSPTGDSVTLDWTSYNPWAERDIVRFDIYISATPFTNITGMTPVQSVSGETVSTTVSGLTEYQDHYIAIVAVDALGNMNLVVINSAAYILSPQVISREVSLFVGAEPVPPYQQAISREVSLVVATLTAPPQVTGYSVTPSPDGSSVALDWSNYNQWLERDIVRFDIYLSDHAFSDITGMTAIRSVAAETSATLLSGLPASRDHFFAIVAVDALGNFNPAVIYSAAYILSQQVISREVSLFVGNEPVPPYASVVSREVSIVVPDSSTPAPVTGVGSGFTALTSATRYRAIDLDWTSYNELIQVDVVRYRIYVDTSFFTNVTGMTPHLLIGAGTQFLTVGSLTGNQTYYSAVVAEDGLGNFNPAVFAVSAQSSVSEIWEPTANSVTFNGNVLLNGATVRAAGTLQVNSAETAAVTRMDFSVRSGAGSDALINSDTTPGDGFSAFWDASLVPDGAYTFTMRAYDNAGRFTEITRNVTLIFNYPPVISAMSFDGSALINGATLTRSARLGVTATDSDGIGSAEFFWQTTGTTTRTSLGTDANPGNGLDIALSLEPLSDGNYDFIARVYDNLGTYAESVRQVTVALLPPVAPAITAPANGTVVTTPTITVTGTATPGTTLKLYRNDVEVFSGAPAANGTFSELMTLVEGANVISADATNRAGTSPRSSSITVTKNQPPPVLALALTQNSVVEGGSLDGTVSIDKLWPQDVVVALGVTAANRLSFPTTVTIPSGQTSAPFTVLAIQNSAVEPVFSLSLIASSTGLTAVSKALQTLDDDTPGIEFTLDQNVVSEGAAGVAVIGTLTLSHTVAVNLTASFTAGPPGQITLPATVLIPANTLSVPVPISIIDNALLDGNRVITLNAQVSLNGGAALITPAPVQLTITDNEGPSLAFTFTHTLLVEGRNPASTATVTVQPVSLSALVVNLTASAPTKVTMPASITIPGGQSSASFDIAAVDDEVASGTQGISFLAETVGYNPAAAALHLTDEQKPDLMVQLIAPPTGAETDAWIDLSLRLTNQGAAAAVGPFTQRFYLSSDAAIGDDITLGQSDFGGSLPANSAIDQTLPMRLPRDAGRYWLVVQTDANSAVDEVIEDNNTSIAITALDVEPAYSATLSIVPVTVPTNTPIPITGTATLHSTGPAKFVLVNIHITNRGMERVISALTNSAGQYSATFTPLPGEGGLIQFGASHPGLSTAPVQDQVNVHGLRADPVSINLNLAENSTHMGSVAIHNLANLSVSGLTANVIGLPAGVQFTPVFADTTLAPEGAALLNYSVTTQEQLDPTSFTLAVTSTEGAAVDVPVRLTVVSNTPRLVADPVRLDAGMLRGQQQIVNFNLRNDGKTATAPVNLLLPTGVAWMQSATALPIPAIAPGASVPVSLQLLPPDTLALGDHTGAIVATDGSTSVTIPFTFRALSDQMGQLVVRAEDEYTYYATGNPPLAGATVRVTDAVSGDLVGTQTTGVSGLVDFGNVREGYYNIEVTADKHGSHRSTYLVQPGITNTAVAFLTRQIVTYTWTVVPTTIEDRYKVTVDTTFETNVPLPVVTIEPAVIDLDDITGDSAVIQLKVTNHGLIAANNTQLNVPTHPGWQFTPLISAFGALPAHSSITVPMTIQRLGTSAPPPPGSDFAPASSGGACSVSATVCWELVCGTSTNRYCASLTFNNASSGCGGGGNIYPIGCSDCVGGGGSSYLQPVTVTTPAPCDPCLARAALDCAIGFVPYAGPAYGWAQCLIAADTNGVWSQQTAESCATNFLPPPAACVWGFLRCKCPGAISTVPACARGLSQGLFAAAIAAPSPFSFGAQSSMVSGPLEYYAGLSYPAIELLQLVLDDPEGYWLAPAGITDAQAWVEAFNSRTLSTSADGLLVSDLERAELIAMRLQAEVSVADVGHIIDRWNRTFTNWRNGIFEPSQVPVGDSTDFISRDAMRGIASRMRIAQAISLSQGHETPELGFSATLLQTLSLPPTGGVCARVKLRLEQEAVITRDAFRATLELGNSSALPLQNVRVDVNIRTTTGTAANALFSVRLEDATTLTAVDGTGSLAANTTGSARWQIIPSVDAAPTVPTQYRVGGTLSYRLDGVDVSLPLYEATITVMPCPRLTLKYFHQRDVFSDDPFTLPIEPAIPYSLAVMIQNNGAGIAKNMRITSAQPKIIENEKGLLADFRIIATQVAGQSLQPSLTANFGNINPGQIKIGEWLMTSSIQGLFIDYSASFEHVDELNDPKFSLIDAVEIHEMIHQVRALGVLDDGMPDFLVNDIPDVLDRPDKVHLSDGTSAPVALVEAASSSGGGLTRTLTATMPAGWVYLRVPEPSDGLYRLTKVTRSDGLELPLDVNAWVTDRTFIGQGLRPTIENILHLFDYNSTGSYTLLYEELITPDTLPPVSNVTALAVNNPTVFPVNWQGSDNRGIAFFDIYVSIDGAAFQPWLERTHESGALFQGEAGRTYAFNSRATDAAGNTEAAHGSADATTSVTLDNQPPVLAAIPVQMVDEGSTFTLNLTANDPDGRNDLLSFNLIGTRPPGLTLNAATRQLHWITGEADGGLEVSLQVVVTDSGFPARSATRSLVIQVIDLNNAPTLQEVSPQRVEPEAVFSLQLQGSDSDLPVQTLQYAFTSPVPAGMTVNADTGLIQWSTTNGLAGSSHTIEVMVSDDATPAASASRQFTVTVETIEGNSAPIAHSSSIRGTVSDLIAGQVTGSDADDDQLTFVVITQPVHGVVTMDADGSYRVRPTPGFAGKDTFTFIAHDGATDSLPATVTLSITPAILEWTWMDGPNTANQRGKYDAGAPPVSPGARSGAASWTDAAGTLWIFGGTGHAATAGPGALNDLWRRDPLTGVWTWLRGSNALNAVGVYETPGQNTPGARSGAVAWMGGDGRLWLFGGANGTGLFNDLWCFDPALSQWTWMSGAQILNANGVYGTQGIAAADNIPGARKGAAGWSDSSGRLWMFGGNGLTTVGKATGPLNDLWRYDPATNQWTFMRGSTLPNSNGAYGALRSRKATNNPGGRSEALAWTGVDDTFWLFGGSGRGSSSAGYLDDLWCYFPMSNEWVWMSGSSGANAAGSQGSLGRSSASSRPGARAGQVGWVDATGALWLFGGQSSAGYWNDVWRYDRAANEWAWMKGPRTDDGVASYGTKGVPAPMNTPGARRSSVAMKDATGDLWLLGGGNGSKTFNDLWKLDLPPVPVVQTLAATAVTSTSADLHAIIHANGLPTKAGFRYWKTDEPSAIISVGAGSAGDSDSPVALTFALSALTPSTNYTVQAFAANVHGQGSGGVITFTTPGPTNPNTVHFTTISAISREEDGTVLVSVELDAPAAFAFSVPFSLSGTATAADYLAPISPINFVAGQTSATVALTLIDNVNDDDDETIIITLDTPTGGMALGTDKVFTLTITDNDEKPLITVEPQSQFRRAGTDTFLTVMASGSAPLSYQWQKNGKKITGATGPSYKITGTPLTAFGNYTVIVNNPTGVPDTSETAELSVVDASSKAFMFAPNGTATMTVTANSPGGLTYAWMHDATDMDDAPPRITGTETKTLVIKQLAAGDAGNYVCHITRTGTGLGVDGGINALSVVSGKPEVLPVDSLTTGVIGGAYSHQIAVNPDPLKAPRSFTVSGLPGGLTVSAGGLISGRPTAAVTNKAITIIARNIAGDSAPEPCTLTILRLPGTVPGAFMAQVDRQQQVNSNLGGRLDLTPTSQGGYSAKLIFNGLTMSASGNLSVTLDDSTEPPLIGTSGHIVFTRPDKTTLALTFTLDAPPDTVSGTLTDNSSSAVANIAGFRNRWSTKGPKATNYQGYYTFGLEIPKDRIGDQSLPQGSGFGSFTVADSGALTFAGRMADDLGFSTTTFTGPNGEIIVFVPFSPALGSLIGTPAIGVGNAITGALSWSKGSAPATSTSQAYRSGFAPVDLRILGGKYAAPPAGAVVMNLSNVDSNARLSFSEGGLLPGQSPPVVFSIRNLTPTGFKQSILMPPLGGLLNPAKVSFALAATPLGQFSGGMIIASPVPTLIRAVKYQGSILTLGTTHQAVGYFMLPQLPQPGQTLMTSPQLSGQVLLEKAP